MSMTLMVLMVLMVLIIPGSGFDAGAVAREKGKAIGRYIYVGCGRDGVGAVGFID